MIKFKYLCVSPVVHRYISVQRLTSQRICVWLRKCIRCEELPARVYERKKKKKEELLTFTMLWIKQRANSECCERGFALQWALFQCSGFYSSATSFRSNTHTNTSVTDFPWGLCAKKNKTCTWSHTHTHILYGHSQAHTHTHAHTHTRTQQVLCHVGSGASFSPCFLKRESLAGVPTYHV